jgi:hypothetical protein
MNPQVQKPVDINRILAMSADEWNRLPPAEQQRCIAALRHHVDSRAPTITKAAAKPKVTAHVLVKMQHLRSSGFDVDAVIRDLRSQGADDAAVIVALEGCAERAAL